MSHQRAMRPVWLIPLIVLGACAATGSSPSDDPAALAVAADTTAPAAGSAADNAASDSAAPADDGVPALKLPAPGAAAESSNGDAAQPAPTTPTTVGATTPTPPPTSGTTPTMPRTAPPTTVAPTTAPPTTPAPAVSDFPVVSLVDIADRQTADMTARLGGGDRPILLWFWTPY